MSSLLPDRETRDWIDLADKLGELGASQIYDELLQWLQATRHRDCPDFDDPALNLVKSTTQSQRDYLLGLRRGYARAIKAIPEFRAYCEAQATRERSRDAARRKNDAAGREARDEFK